MSELNHDTANGGDSSRAPAEPRVRISAWVWVAAIAVLLFTAYTVFETARLRKQALTSSLQLEKQRRLALELAAERKLQK